MRPIGQTPLIEFGTELGITFDYMTFPGCPPLFGFYKVYGELGLKVDHPTQIGCRQMVSRWRAQVEAGQYDFVVIGGRWGSLTEPVEYGELRLEYAQLAVPGEAVPAHAESRALLAQGLDRTIAVARKAGAGVLLLGQVPHSGRMIEDCGELSRFLPWRDGPRQAIIGRCRGIARIDALDHLAFSNRAIAERSREDVVGFLPSQLLCANTAAPCATVVDGKLLYKNSDHINGRGALYMAPMLELAVKCVLAAKKGEKRRETVVDEKSYEHSVPPSGAVVVGDCQGLAVDAVAASMLNRRDGGAP